LQDVQRATWRRATVHYGKWLTASSAVAFTVMAAQEHHTSARAWDGLLTMCRSSGNACTLAPDGRYQAVPAESLYQRSLHFDRRARHRLLGAQASLLVTAALFLLDLRPGDGPDNIPFAPLRVTASPTEGRLHVGMRFAF
jgi:hypothetical protein